MNRQIVFGCTADTVGVCECAVEVQVTRTAKVHAEILRALDMLLESFQVCLGSRLHDHVRFINLRCTQIAHTSPWCGFGLAPLDRCSASRFGSTIDSQKFPKLS